MAYVGYRPILPGQSTGNWTHRYKGAGEYSNWSLQSTTQPLEDAPINPRYPGDVYQGQGRLSQVYAGRHGYSPMELAKYSHGGQDAPYLRHINYRNHSVPSARVFPDDFGHDGTRETSDSRWSNLEHRGVPSAEVNLEGHQQRAYGEGAANFGPTRPYEHQGVGERVLADAGETLDEKPQGFEYAFQETQEWHGVPSARVL